MPFVPWQCRYSINRRLIRYSDSNRHGCTKTPSC